MQGVDPKDVDKVIIRKLIPEEPFCGLAFKIVDDKFGTLTYVRIYSGVLEQGTRVLNANKGNLSRENISAVVPDARPTIPAFCAATALNRATSSPVIGERSDDRRYVLCDLDHPIVLERPTFPRAGDQHVGIEPKTAADKDKLSQALTNLRRQDPTFFANYNKETGETIIAGMGELAP